MLMFEVGCVIHQNMIAHRACTSNYLDDLLPELTIQLQIVQPLELIKIQFAQKFQSLPPDQILKFQNLKVSYYFLC